VVYRCVIKYLLVTDRLLLRLLKYWDPLFIIETNFVYASKITLNKILYLL